ncbi:MAG TPA: hypothetical protein DCK98_01540 [Chloroflexi bacterium]|nr:hypothetical protein [Chloroflexota bacterium]HAL25835.1 hypothetical protein [Chloroflexota bacterium]
MVDNVMRSLLRALRTSTPAADLRLSWVQAELTAQLSRQSQVVDGIASRAAAIIALGAVIFVAVTPWPFCSDNAVSISFLFAWAGSGVAAAAALAGLAFKRLTQEPSSAVVFTLLRQPTPTDEAALRQVIGLQLTAVTKNESAVRWKARWLRLSLVAMLIALLAAAVGYDILLTKGLGVCAR